MCLRKIMIRRRPTSNVLAGLRFFRRDGLPRQPYRDMIAGARSRAVLGSLFLVVFPWFVVSGRRRFGSVVWPGRFVGRVVRVARCLPRMGRTVTGSRRHRTRRHGPYGARGYRQCGGQDPSEGQYAADFHDSRFLGSTNGVVRPVRYGGTVIRTEGIAFIKDSEKRLSVDVQGLFFGVLLAGRISPREEETVRPVSQVRVRGAVAAGAKHAGPTRFRIDPATLYEYEKCGLVYAYKAERKFVITPRHVCIIVMTGPIGVRGVGGLFCRRPRICLRECTTPFVVGCIRLCGQPVVSRARETEFDVAVLPERFVRNHVDGRLGVVRTQRLDLD